MPVIGKKAKRLDKRPSSFKKNMFNILKYGCNLHSNHDQYYTMTGIPMITRHSQRFHHSQQKRGILQMIL